jgi:hypothetical protein
MVAWIWGWPSPPHGPVDHAAAVTDLHKACIKRVKGFLTRLKAIDMRGI